MKQLFLIKKCRIQLLLVFLALAFSASASADFAILVDQAVLVEKNPEPAALVEDEELAEQPVIGEANDASYVSFGGWAVTGAEFIDANVVVFDLGANSTVSQATLRLPIEELYPQNGAVPLEIFVFSDNGHVEYTDYSIGFISPIADLDAALLTQIEVDVTGAVNAALGTGRYVAFRINSKIAPTAVLPTLFPAWTGAKFRNNPSLEFTPGAPPIVANDVARFDGYTLQVPNIEVPGVGEAAVQLRMIDANQLRFQLTFAEITGAGVGAPPLSGIELFDCAAFTAPSAVTVAAGTSTYSVNSEILDIPSVNFNEEQVALRLEHIEGTDPWVFETLSMGEVQAGPSEATVSALGGGLIVEPSQDFVPLCHGWVLIGDSIRNRVVERNLISGETGNTYSFNTIPDQFTLDDANGAVYMTVHPESERLYRLDLNTGLFSSNRVEQVLGAGPTHTYNWSLRDIALGEDGNVFAIMFDNIQIDPENGVPYSDTGLWMGVMDPDANFLTDSLPLEEPIRIEYDPVLDHVFLATQSNLATFNFDTVTHAMVMPPESSGGRK